MALLVRRAFRHLSRVHDVLFRRTLLEREITIFDDDVFLTSYPRSGNTWTRFLVGNFVNPNEPVTFLNVERLVPDPMARLLTNRLRLGSLLVADMHKL